VALEGLVQYANVDELIRNSWWGLVVVAREDMTRKPKMEIPCAGLAQRANQYEPLGSNWWYSAAVDMSHDEEYGYWECIFEDSVSKGINHISATTNVP